MQGTDDAALLRQFAENGSEEAFATLVGQHINLVYSVALRHVDHPHQAEEVAQAVVIVLARKARELRNVRVLSAWLFQATRLTAANFMRREIRRARREQEAYMQSTFNQSETEVWEQIAPSLDTVVARLPEKDRHAIILRFYEGKTLREVGAALAVSEDAAYQRVNRAVEKLRQFFTKTGVVLPATALATAISANSVQAAPAGVGAAAVGAALQPAALATSATGLVQATLSAMKWAKLKFALTIGAPALVVIGVSVPLALSGRNSAASGFGPVIERVIHSDLPRTFGTGRIDFDTGNQPPLPANVGRNADVEHLVWMRQEGVDAITQIFGWRQADGRTITLPGMAAFDMDVIPLSGDPWNSITSVSIRQQLLSAKSQDVKNWAGLTTKVSNIASTNELPLTYLFKTREGAMGILQITEYTKNPRGVKCRYKLVQSKK